MELSYKKLFTVTLHHDFFGGDEFTGFTIVPSDDCRQFFNNSGILSKTIGNTFIALIEENTGKAKRPVSQPTIFRLYVKFTDTFFSNVTNLSYAPNLRQRLYFSNKVKNKVGSTLCLSLPIALHDGTRVYDPGTLVKESGTDKIFECIKTTTVAPVINLSDKTFWVEKSMTSYASGSDTMNVKDTNFIFTASFAQSFFRIKFSGYNTNTDDYDIVAKPDETIYIKSDSTDKVSINMSGLKAGRYQIDVNGELYQVYYDPFLLQNKFDGVIEIYNNLLATDDYALFDASGKMKETAFTIALNNKRSIWKYVTVNTFLDTITDTSGEFNFTPNVSKSEFLSDKPIPLLNVPPNTFVLNFSLSSPPALKDLKARSPSVSIIRKDGNYFYSDINLTY